MRALVTGATGLIGNALAMDLVARGHDVRALVRDPGRARAVLPERVTLVRGDVTAPESLSAAMRDVEWLFHAAGMPEQWQRDEGIFDRVNRQGTANVLDAALAAGVKRVVYTSTMDVFAAERGGTLVESRVDPEPKHTAYERSKQAAEREAEARRERGLDLVYVNPSAVYGPSPVHIGLNSFFVQLLSGKMPMVPPGGMSVVYVDGCTQAHVAAAERGASGERYLVADQHVTCEALADEIARQAGVNRPRNGPVWLVRALAAVSAPLARALRFRPLVYTSGGHGRRALSDDELDELVAAAARAGWRLCIHAIGDEAVEAAARALEDGGTRGNRIEHCQLTTPRAIASMVAAGTVPVPQMAFLRQRSKGFVDACGPERTASMYPLRSWIDSGLRPVHSSDAPVIPDARPMPALETAVTRRDERGEVWGADQAISVDEGLAMMTSWAAAADGEEGIRGRIAPGRLADFTVLAEDPHLVPGPEIAEIPVRMAIVAGRVRTIDR